MTVPRRKLTLRDLFVVFGRTGKHADEQYELYEQATSDLPPGSVTYACEKLIKHAKGYLPAPAEIRDLAVQWVQLQRPATKPEPPPKRGPVSGAVQSLFSSLPDGTAELERVCGRCGTVYTSPAGIVAMQERQNELECPACSGSRLRRWRQDRALVRQWLRDCKPETLPSRELVARARLLRLDDELNDTLQRLGLLSGRRK